MLLFIITLVSSASLTFGNQVPQDPKDVAYRLVNATLVAIENNLEYPDVGNWTYQGALVVRGLWEMQKVYPEMDLEPFLHKHLNYFQTEPSEYGYKMLNNISIDFSIEENNTIGDYIGLFPITYGDRLRYASDFDAFSIENDTFIIEETVIKYIYGFPHHLVDGLISRPTWADGQYNIEGKYIWIDDSYMGTGLGNDLSRISGDSFHVLESARQHLLFRNHLRDSDDRLYFHGNNNFTGDMSCCKWGRGNGWSIMGKMETLATLVDLGLENVNIYKELLDAYIDHSKGLLELQSNEGGWHNVVTNEDTFVETSGTAMYLLSFIKGVVYGWLDKEEFSESIEKAWAYISGSVLDDGTVRDIVMGTSVQLNDTNYDRSRDFKLSGPGLGAVVRCVAAYGEYIKEKLP